MRPRALLLVAALAALVAGCGGSGDKGGSGGGGESKVLVGAGSTLVAPLLSQWSNDYAKTHGVTITYGAIGSGGGIECGSRLAVARRSSLAANRQARERNLLGVHGSHSGVT